MAKKSKQTTGSGEVERKFRVSPTRVRQAMDSILALDGNGPGTIPSRRRAAGGVTVTRSPSGHGSFLETEIAHGHDVWPVFAKPDRLSADEIAYALVGDSYWDAQSILRNALDHVRL